MKKNKKGGIMEEKGGRHHKEKDIQDILLSMLN